MIQRVSGYDRINGDTYVTPKWVFDALYSVEKFSEPWDCAPVDADFDFLAQETLSPAREIVTNPPYKQSDAFVERALILTEWSNGKVAMLLPHEWDTSHSRRHLFSGPPFKAKYTLTQRIRWVNLDQKKNGPSSNHAWLVWDWSYSGTPQLRHL